MNPRLKHSAVLGLLFACLVSAPIFPSAVPGNVYLNDPSNSGPATVELPRLHGDGTRLEGQYARISSYRLTPDGDFISGIDGAADFRYQPSPDSAYGCHFHVDQCSAFDAVNVYYHIDKFATEFWRGRLGLDIDFQAQVQIHFPVGGAAANPATSSLRFGLGDTMTKNSALEDDIIYHEYSHLVTDFLGFHVDTTSLVQTRAINEGFAHYFAASYTDDPRIGEWVVRCPPREHCAGPENDEEMATLETPPSVWNWNEGEPAQNLAYGVCTRYHDVDGKCKIGYHNFTEAYTWGMIWGGTLWDIRERVGADVTDRLVVHGILKMAAADPQFEDAIRSIVEAELKIYGGEHLDDIKSVLSERGFSRIAEHVAADDEGLTDELVLDLVGSHPIREAARFAVDLPDSRRLSLVVYDALGRRVQVLEDRFVSSGRHEYMWYPKSLAAGKYFAVLISGSTRKSLSLTFIP